MNILMSGHVLWSYEDEVAQSGLREEISALFSLIKPLHHHEGEIALTDTNLIINLNIPLGKLNQLYLGFDEVFKPTYVKNAGMFWQPLRLRYNENDHLITVYLIIDHSFIGTLINSPSNQ